MKEQVFPWQNYSLLLISFPTYFVLKVCVTPHFRFSKYLAFSKPFILSYNNYTKIGMKGKTLCCLNWRKAKIRMYWGFVVGFW